MLSQPVCHTYRERSAPDTGACVVVAVVVVVRFFLPQPTIVPHVKNRVSLSIASVFILNGSLYKPSINVRK